MKEKNSRRSGYILLGLVCMIFNTMQCDKGTNPSPTPKGALELLYPKGGSGQSFKVGDTVTIRWSIHNTDSVVQVGISYSLDDGKTVPTTQIIAGHSFSYPDTTYQWIIGSEHCSDKFILCIWEYNSSCFTASSSCRYPHDRSASFIVRQ